jgi:hypothetical protein
MTTTDQNRRSKIVACVHAADSKRSQPVAGALVLAYRSRKGTTGKTAKPLKFGDHELGAPVHIGVTERNGYCTLMDVEPGDYDLYCRGHTPTLPQCVTVAPGCTTEVCFEDPVRVAVTSSRIDDCEAVKCDHYTVDQPVMLQVETSLDASLTTEEVGALNPGGDVIQNITWNAPRLTYMDDLGSLVEFVPSIAGRNSVALSIKGRTLDPALADGMGIDAYAHQEPETLLEQSLYASKPTPQAVQGNLGVTMKRSATNPTEDQPLWVAIRNRTHALSFNGGGKGASSGFKNFVDRVLCDGLDSGDTRLDRKVMEVGGYVHGLHAYDLLKTAAEVFLLMECGVRIERKAGFSREEEANRLGQPVDIDSLRRQLRSYLSDKRLPYIDRVLEAAFPGNEVGNMHCDNVLSAMVDGPCLLELIWSYWHEEGMLVQSINSIARRFQNIRAPGDRDPLAHLEIAPLRPLNNILWGYIQEEQSRLSVKRRAYEYDHHYGLSLYGKAVPTLRTADSRSKFLEAFHNLLNICSLFYKDHNDTTIIPDGFPLLNALKEVHLILAQGAHNQHGDLPWTSRAEMLVQQWIMARPEIRDFLQSRAMVPYKEAWMPQVDTMKTLQGWSDVTVTHFRDLGVYGEQILLSVRYGDWIDINDEDSAKNWAVYFRPEIQSYLHAYRAVTGVDLANSDTVDSTPPSVHLRKRLAAQVVSR